MDLLRRVPFLAWRVVVGVGVVLLAACAPPTPSGTISITFPVSAVGTEAEVLKAQLTRFSALHPQIVIEPLVTPDSANERHQLFVQWLNAGVGDPDVLQLDVAWTAEFAAAGWIRPVSEFGLEIGDYLVAAVDAATYRQRAYAIPWFVDVGMLYWRTDLLSRAPSTLEELASMAVDAERAGRVEHGLVWQAARYEGLVTVLLEILGAHGAEIIDREGNVVIDSPQAASALSWMREAIHDRDIAPEQSLTWREERARLAFERGEALFMRNWPYAWSLMNAPDSRVAGRFAVAPMPGGPGGKPTAALGGQQLAINAHSEHPDAAAKLVSFLTEPAQMLERWRVVGQLPPRPSLYNDPRMAVGAAIPPADARAIIERATSRPVTPIYSELSQILQVHFHRILTNQVAAEPALREAAGALRERLDAHRTPPSAVSAWPWLLGGVIVVGLAAGWLVRRRRAVDKPVRTSGLAWVFVTPALAVIGLVGAFPLLWTGYESLHHHDLRAPGHGQPFIGMGNYVELLSSERFWAALGHTFFFSGTSVVLETTFGLVLALVVNQVLRWRGVVRTTVLIPWAIPTVVVALVWRFLFEGPTAIANQAAVGVGLLDGPLAWFADSLAAWVPIVTADVWKTTPFVALMLLAGLQTIDASLYEAAWVDGAGAFNRFRYVTLPMLRPTLLVVLLFRTMDAFRVFDLVYVLTGGGPGTATEPVALFTFSALLEHLRFGYGSAAAVLLFGVTFLIASAYLKLWQSDLEGDSR